jgi:hypothetical protein
MNDITQHLCLSSVAKVVVNCFEKVPLLRDEMIELPRLVWTGVEIMQSWPIPRIRVDFNVHVSTGRALFCVVDLRSQHCLGDYWVSATIVIVSNRKWIRGLLALAWNRRKLNTNPIESVQFCRAAQNQNSTKAKVLRGKIQLVCW